MSTDKRTATKSTSILSDDLVEEILSWVPARSLKLSRSTCKQWNTLFNDHKFTKKHFDKAPKEFLVLMRVGLDVLLVSVDLRGVRNNVIAPSIELKGEFGKLGDMCPISHCNGLLLCINRYKYYGTRLLMVSNPCTGQTRSIETRIRFRDSEILALGYQNKKSCSASYKILRFGWESHPGDYKFEIYEFSSDLWKVLDDVTDDDWFLGPQCRGVSFQGNTYWIALDKYDQYDTFLLQFDFTKERFQRFRLPFKCDCDYDTLMLSTREEHLAVFLHRQDESTSEIWLTKKIDEPNSVPWRFLFRVDSGHKTLSFLYAMSFMVDEENKIAMCFHDECIGENLESERTILSIVGEGNISIRLIGSPVDQNLWLPMPYLLSYVPSLVQI